MTPYRKIRKIDPVRKRILLRLCESDKALIDYLESKQEKKQITASIRAMLYRAWTDRVPKFGRGVGLRGAVPTVAPKPSEVPLVPTVDEVDDITKDILEGLE